MREVLVLLVLVALHLQSEMERRVFALELPPIITRPVQIQVQALNVSASTQAWASLPTTQMNLVEEIYMLRLCLCLCPSRLQDSCVQLIGNKPGCSLAVLGLAATG